jgi:DNA-binding NtrC family response regulator
LEGCAPDLYYRLKAFQIPIPPLRERLEDLELLVVHFIEEINREQSKDVEGLDNEALALLKAHTWPGNVREFRNVIEQAVVMREHGRLTPRDLPDEIYKERHKPASLTLHVGTSMREAERQFAALTLDANDGNRARTARTLQVSRNRLYELLPVNGVPPPNNRRPL